MYIVHIHLFADGYIDRQVLRIYFHMDVTGLSFRLKEITNVCFLGLNNLLKLAIHYSDSCLGVGDHSSLISLAFS